VNTHRALAIVAIEIPVDPTVPSKIREPVYGCKSPSRSASSITLKANSQRKAFVKYHIEHTSECDTVLYAAPRVEILQKRWFSGTILSPHMRTSALPRISTPNASLSELIRTSGVFPIQYTQTSLSAQEQGHQSMTITHRSTLSLRRVSRRSAIRWGVG
jgi:hypothetical protein